MINSKRVYLKTNEFQNLKHRAIHPQLKVYKIKAFIVILLIIA
jgi:hypothetical protein